MQSLKSVLKKTFFISAVFLAACMLPDEDPLKNPKFNFLNLEKNEISFSDTKSIYPFFEKLKDLHIYKKRQVRILHIGDSHIQDGTFSGTVRTLLQSDRRFGEAGRGFFFPYAAAETNNPRHFQTIFTGEWTGKRSVIKSHYSRWGLAGLSAGTTNPNAGMVIRQTSYNGHPVGSFDRVKIFYPTEDKQNFDVKLPRHRNYILSAHRADLGYKEFSFTTPQRMLMLQVCKTSPYQRHFVMQGISFETDRAGIVYSAVGANGAEVNSFFRCKDFERNLKVVNPDLVIISLGTNDAWAKDFSGWRYKTEYKKLIAKVRNANPNTCILLTAPNDFYKFDRHSKNVKEVVRRLRELRDEENVVIWDFHTVMGGDYSMKKWVSAGLGKRDLVHFTEKGYRCQGRLFHEAFIKKAYEDFLDASDGN